MHDLSDVGHALQVVVCCVRVHLDGSVRIILSLSEGGGLVVVVEPVLCGHQMLQLVELLHIRGGEASKGILGLADVVDDLLVVFLRVELEGQVLLLGQHLDLLASCLCLLSWSYTDYGLLKGVIVLSFLGHEHYCACLLGNVLNGFSSLSNNQTHHVGRDLDDDSDSALQLAAHCFLEVSLVLDNVIEHDLHLLAGLITALHKDIPIERTRGNVCCHLHISGS